MPYANRQQRLEYQRRWNREYYQKNRASEKRRITMRKVAIAQWLATLKAALKCEQCRERDPSCLDFHHERGVKDFNLGQVRSRGWGKVRIMQEIKKCRVLCANCHRKEHTKKS